MLPKKLSPEKGSDNLFPYRTPSQRPNTPRRTQNGPKRIETARNTPKQTRNRPKSRSLGWAGCPGTPGKTNRGLASDFLLFRKALDTFKFLRHVMRAIILFVQPKCSHRCVSLKESPLKLVQILKHAAKISTEQTSMRTKWFKHITI